MQQIESCLHICGNCPASLTTSDGVVINVKEYFRLLVGAPRGNSSHRNHLNITEPGMVYQCRIEGDGNCTSQLLDSAGTYTLYKSVPFIVVFTRRCGLSVLTCVLSSRQLIPLMMLLAYTIWISAAPTPFRKL